MSRGLVTQHRYQTRNVLLNHSLNVVDGSRINAKIFVSKDEPKFRRVILKALFSSPLNEILDDMPTIDSNLAMHRYSELLVNINGQYQEGNIDLEWAELRLKDL